MSNRIKRAAVCAALTCGVLGVSAPAAFAELGGTPTPPPAGAVSSSLGTVAHAASGGTSAASFTVTQTTYAAGTLVREYASTAGTVFGIAWNGPIMPNLPMLLGSYFTQYDSARVALRASQPGRGPISLDLPGLVVHSGGHMGGFSGQAYLPQSLPAGVTAADIQ